MRLADWIAEVEISRAGLARRLGVSWITLWRWLTGRAHPSARSVARIERITDGRVTARDLQ